MRPSLPPYPDDRNVKPRTTPLVSFAPAPPVQKKKRASMTGRAFFSSAEKSSGPIAGPLSSPNQRDATFWR